MSHLRRHRKAFAQGLVIILALLMLPAPDWATCGGGGGGGGGGMRSGPVGGGGMEQEQVYPVSWHMRGPNDPPAMSGLVLYWFPTGVDEFRRSSLRNSRVLSLYATQCVSMEVADSRSPVGQKLA